MEPGETVRAECRECLITFSLTLAPPSEWREIPAEGATTRIDPAFCPFCGCDDLKMTTAPDEPVMVVDM